MKKIFFLVFFCLLITGAFSFCPKASAETVLFPANHKVTTTTVLHTGNVYVIPDFSSLTVNASGTVIMQPGSILKIGFNSFIQIYGNFYASGTKDEMISIVSIKDDFFGGDTNGDGTTTSAGIGEWRGIYFQGGSANGLLNYVTVRSGGATQTNTPGKLFRGSVISAYLANSMRISNSRFIDNKGKISFSNSRNVSMNNSDIYNPTYCDYNDPYNDCHWDNSVTCSSQADLTNNYWGHEDGPSYADVYDPTYFTGVVLDVYRGSAIYQPFARKPFFANKLNPIILIPGIMGSWKVKGQWQLDPILNTYDDLWEAFKAVGYEEGVNLFAFPYQWRDNNVSNTDDLMRKIGEVKEVSGSDKVDLVGHSMGGLLARSYIESTYYNNDVDKLVFIATPHLGAPKSYLVWEGADLGIGINNFMYELLFELEAYKNGYGNLYNYIRDNISSVRDLLPIYDYIKESDSGDFRTYPENYPRNHFLELLNQESNMQNLEAVDVLNIVADNNKKDTLDYMVVEDKYFDDGRWEHGYPINYDGLLGIKGLVNGSGDGTVPQRSNNGLFENELTFNSNHTKIVSDSQKEIINFLSGNLPLNDISNNIFEKWFMVRIYSPANFLIKDPQGNRVGMDAEGNEISEINKSFYFNEDGMQFALIPNPGEGDYKVELLGTADGDYKLNLAYVDEESIVQRNFMGNIIEDQQQEFLFDFNPSEEEENFLTDLMPEDVTAPVIQIVKPNSGEKFFRSQILSLEYQVYDDYSSNVMPSITLNGENVTSSTIDLSFYSVGTYELRLTATDSAGNSSVETVELEIIANIKTSIKDIENFYESGLLTKEAKNKLLPPLKQLERDFELFKGSKSNTENKLNTLDIHLKNLKKQGKLDDLVYDIIKANIDYLRINLLYE